MTAYVHWIRQHVGREKILLAFAGGCIRNKAGRVLWQRRSDSGWWGLPGGALELDESLPECIVREAREETGLTVLTIFAQCSIIVVQGTLTLLYRSVTSKA